MKASTVTGVLLALGLVAAATVPAGAFPKKQVPVPSEAAEPPSEEAQRPPPPPAPAGAAPVGSVPGAAAAPAPAETKLAPPAAPKPAPERKAGPAPKAEAAKPAKAPAQPKPELGKAGPTEPPLPPQPVRAAARMPNIDPTPERVRWAVVCRKLALDCTPWDQFPQLMPYEFGARLPDAALSRSDKRVAVSGWPYDLLFDRGGKMKGRIATDILNQVAMAGAGQDVVVDPEAASMRGVAQVVMGGEGGYVALQPQDWAQVIANRIGVPSIAPQLVDAAMVANSARTPRIAMDGTTAVMILPSSDRAQPPHGALGVDPGQIMGMTCVGGIAVLTFPAPAGTAKPGQPVLAMVDNLLFCAGGTAGLRIMERMPS